MSSEEVILSSGRVIGANRGIVGINAAGVTFEGYDGPIDPWPRSYAPGWAQSERDELADVMIKRWERFKKLTARPDDE